MPITVVNIRKHTITEDDYYCGRPSPLGNPFTDQPLADTLAQFQCSTREEAIEKYEPWLIDRILKKDGSICDMLNQIYKKTKAGLHVYLLCFCKPKKCHCDAIKKVIDQKLNNAKEPV